LEGAEEMLVPALIDIAGTVTIAPIFSVGEPCLLRPPPSNKLCVERNKPVGFAVQFSEGFCRDVGSLICDVDWEVMQLTPSYQCHPRAAMYQNIDSDYDYGICGRIVEPKGEQDLLVREAMKRIVEDGWTVDDENMIFVDVRPDPCVSGAEDCIAEYSAIGHFGAFLAAVAAFCVIFPCGIVASHDYLLHQITLLDKRELDHHRKVRRAQEADKVRANEAMQFEKAQHALDVERTFFGTSQMPVELTLFEKERQARIQLALGIEPGYGTVGNVTGYLAGYGDQTTILGPGAHQMMGAHGPPGSIY